MSNGIVLKKDKTFKAIWKVKEYEYTLFLNGGTISGASSDMGTFTYQFNDGTDTEIPTPKRVGYNFSGWYKSPNFIGGSITKWENGVKEYYAKWTPITYTINFDLSGSDTCSPTFAYKSLNFTTDNLPFTLGKPVANGWSFNGWILNGTSKVTEVNVSLLEEFVNNSISVVASWTSKNTTYFEELYLESASKSDVYELYKTSEKTANTGSKISDTNKTFTGFNYVKMEDNSNGTVKGSGTIVKYYFARNQHSATLNFNKNYGTLESWNDVSSSSIDSNNSTVKTILSFEYNDTDIILPEIKSSGRYHFQCWLDSSGKPVKRIPSRTDMDLDFYAYFTQDAPTLDDLTISRSSTDLTISSSGNTLKNANSEVSPTKETNGALKFTSSIVYNNISSTQYAFIQFVGETYTVGESTIQGLEPSPIISIPIKYTQSAPTTSSDYTIDNQNSTISPQNGKSLEVLYNDGSTVDLTSNFQLPNIDSLNIRFKETYKTISSATTQVKKTDLNEQTTANGESGQGSVSINSIFSGDPKYITVTDLDASNIGSINISGIPTANLMVCYTGKNKIDESVSIVWNDVTSTKIVVTEVGNYYFKYKVHNNFAESAVFGPAVVKYSEVKVTLKMSNSSTESPNDYAFPTLGGVNNTADKEIYVLVNGQLCTSEEFIELMDGITRYGYTPTLPSSTDFWYQFSNGIGYPKYNVASLVKKDLTLYAKWTPNTNTYSLIDKVRVIKDGVNYDLDYKNPTSTTITYGKDYNVSYTKNDTTDNFSKITLSESSKSEFLNLLEKNPLQYPTVIKQLGYYVYDNESIVKNCNFEKISKNDSVTISSTTVPSTLDLDVPKYKFLPIYDLSSQKSNIELATVTYKVENNSTNFTVTKNTNNKDLFDYSQVKIKYVIDEDGLNTLELHFDNENFVTDYDVSKNLTSENNSHTFTVGGVYALVKVYFHATMKHWSIGEKIVENTSTYEGTDFYATSDNTLTVLSTGNSGVTNVWTATIENAQ